MTEAQRRHRGDLGRVLLAAFALTCVIRGFSYMPWGDKPSALPPGLDLLVSFLPIWVWGIFWFLAGLAGIAVAIRPTKGLLFGAMMALSFVHVVWSLSYIGGFLVDGGRTYLNAATYIGLTIGMASILREVRANRRR